MTDDRTAAFRRDDSVRGRIGAVEFAPFRPCPHHPPFKGPYPSWTPSPRGGAVPPRLTTPHSRRGGVAWSGPVSCPVCRKRFPSLHGVRAHLSRMHPTLSGKRLADAKAVVFRQAWEALLNPSETRG
jgi:hypothetical protein